MTATAQKTNGRARVPRVVEPIGEPEARSRSLNEALLAFQAEAPKLTRDATGQIQSRTYGYTTLDGLLDDITPLLLKHELLWKVKPTTDEHGQPAARYSMTHVPSGESDEDVVPLPMERPSPQAFGSALTYMRRYAMQAYLGLAPGEDDDGAAASTVPVTAPQTREQDQNTPVQTNVRQPTAAPAKPSERPASAAQRKMLRAKANAAHLAIDDFANIIKEAAGEKDPDPWQDKDAATRWVDRALDRLPARLVDPIILGIEGSKPRAN